MSRQTKTFRQMVTRNLLVSAFLISLPTAYFGAQDLTHDEPVTTFVPGWAVGEEDFGPAPAGSPQAIAEAHDCWTGEAPADMKGVIPGHVVVAQGENARYAGSRMVGKALDQIFNDKDHGIAVFAFCR